LSCCGQSKASESMVLSSARTFEAQIGQTAMNPSLWIGDPYFYRAGRQPAIKQGEDR
jgi:hypothetical protein